MNDTPTATIRIGRAGREPLSADGVVYVTVGAAALPLGPPYRLCTLQPGTQIVAEVDGGFRLMSPDGAMFEIVFRGLHRRAAA